MLVKQGLVGIRNGCIATRRDLDSINLQLVAAGRYFLKTTVHVLEFDTIQKFKFSVM